ncbi:hypothetical protein [Brumimicrobium mesophilum]|uniref:hypothetical protein n=1 Tax=Brumimicrobium mesophilum TaxID=392717 RepID=UPI000D141E5C|nr:hypothetical protein [Brumimicrobium mesophilum]
MKKLIFVISGFLLLSLGSCNKDEINPNQHRDFESREFCFGGTDDDKSCTGNTSTGSRGTNDPTITDPNRDEDEEVKSKQTKN